MQAQVMQTKARFGFTRSDGLDLSRLVVANSADTKSIPGPMPEPVPPASRGPLYWTRVLMARVYA